MTAPALAAAPTGRLALLFQEPLTAVVRLRAGRQPVTDAAAFRAQLLQLLGRADQESRTAGYDASDVRLATFAVVAFHDESVLNQASPVFVEWARRPLQDELFGGHLGGEYFFQYAAQLLARPDTPALADLLELFELCLLLGFRGRYGASDAGELHAVTARLDERVRRMRGAPGDLAPAWRPPDDAVIERDPWVRRLTLAAAAAVVLAVALWGAGALALRGAVAAVRADAPAPDASAAAPNTVSNKAPNKAPNKMPDTVSDAAPNASPDTVPNTLSDVVPNTASGAVPGVLPDAAG